jgi:hypothetical protein
MQECNFSRFQRGGLVKDPCALGSPSLRFVTICSLMSQHSDKVQPIAKTKPSTYLLPGSPRPRDFLIEQPSDIPFSCNLTP